MRVFQLLCSNLAMNSVKNAMTYPFALGDKQGVGSITISDYEKPGNFGAASIVPAGALIKIETIDSFKLPACHLIKIDVEGFEVKVITGALETIRRCRPILYVENDRQGKQQELIDLIDFLSYNSYWHVTPLGEAFPGIGSVNMLCVPCEAPIKIEGFERIDPKDWKTLAGLVQ
jgi:FkbM family methyltransferase